MIRSYPNKPCYIIVFLNQFKCCNSNVYVAKITDALTTSSKVVLLSYHLKIQADYAEMGFFNGSPENLPAGTIDLAPGQYKFQIYAVNSFSDSLIGLNYCYEDILNVPIQDIFVEPA